MSLTKGNTKLKVEISSVYTEVINSTVLDWSGRALGEEDVTTTNDAGKDQQFITTIGDNGTISATLNPYIPNSATHQYLNSLYTSGDSNNFQFQAGGRTVQFAGYVSKANPVLTVMNNLALEVVIAINGSMTAI
jgi:hypothetical protein